MKGYFDIAGDGGSNVAAQVIDKRSRVDAALAGVRHLVAVGSGKGGVGKSTVTIQLARSLAADGRAVAILDADLNGPSQARLAGLRAAPLLPGPKGMVLPRAAPGFGVVSLGAFVPEAEAIDFDSVAPGDSYVWRATKEFSVLADLLAGVEWGALDVLLIDLPPGAERTVQIAEFLGKAASLVLVTIPSDLSRAVVLRTIAGLRALDNRLLGVVENMKGYLCPGCNATRPLFSESGTMDLGIARLGAVPFDPALAAASDRGEALPAARHGATAEAFSALARNLWTVLSQ